MDYLSPIEALFPGVGGSVLAVLAQTTEPLTIRQIAERARATHPQVARHVERFEALGVVRRRIAGRSHLVTLTASVAAGVLRQLVHLEEAVLEQMKAAADRIEPHAESIVVFGSFARGAAGVGSDIDVAIVAPAGLADDPAWLESLAAWVDHVAEAAGNPVAELVVSADELRAREGDPLWEDIRRDGIVVSGAPLDELMTATGPARSAS